MKRLVLIVAALTLVSFSSYAQLFTIGPKIGLSSSKINVKEDVEEIVSGDAAVGFHAGLFTRVSILGFYVQPEVLFTSASGNIVIDDQDLTNNVEEVQQLTYNKVDIPVMVGFKIGGLLRLNAGPTFSILLDNDARESADFIQDIDTESATVGYQVGVGLDISKLVIDLKYENNLSTLGQNVTIAERQFETDLRNSLFQLTLGWKLL